MRTPFMYVAGLLAFLLVAGPSSAQEGGFGLDLSGDSPSSDESEMSDGEMQDTGSLGLDLSGGMPAAMDLQPRFVLLGLETPRRTPAKDVKRWQGWLMGTARRTGRVALNRTIGDAQATLGSDYDAALRCDEASCFREPAEMLEANLLTVARLAQEGRGWTLRLWTYDRDNDVVETDVVTGRSPTDSRFIREAGAVLAGRLEAHARPRALLKVSVNAPQAVVRVGERMLGLGNVEAKLAPGTLHLSVEAEDYDSFSRTLTLAPGETQEVNVHLEFSGPAPEGPPDDGRVAKKKSGSGSSGGFFTRPALYTALVGLAAVGAGMVMGAQAGAAGANATVDADGDGVLDITRRDYLAARQQSHIATALVAGGGALAAGSAMWLVLVPTHSAPESSKLAAPLTPGPGSGRAMALHLMLGGSF